MYKIDEIIILKDAPRWEGEKFIIKEVLNNESPYKYKITHESGFPTIDICNECYMKPY